MSRNPVFEHFRQQGLLDAKLGPQGVKPGEVIKIPAFTYRGHKLVNQAEIMRVILGCRYPYTVLADSCLFSPARIGFVEGLLNNVELRIHPRVRQELSDIEGKPVSPLKDLLFPKGKLNPALIELPHWGINGFNYLVNKYVNLIHFRKRVLDAPLDQFREQNGREATGKEREKLVRQLLAEGVSWRTIRLATKQDRNRRHTDEALVTHGVLSPILTGQDCYILTADRDVFDQFYQLTQLVFDDFSSHWIGEQFRKYPDRFEHVHEHKSPYMDPGALASVRPEKAIRPKSCENWWHLMEINKAQ